MLFRSLDLAQQLRVLALLADEVHQRQRCVLLSVHDLSLAQRVATHVLLLDGQGQALAGPVEQVMQPDTLSRVWGHPLRAHDHDGHRWWLPA